MWNDVPRSDWPVWAQSSSGVWRNKQGDWLSSQTTSHSTLWELRTSNGDVFSNQMDLPFNVSLGGPPLNWANQEIAGRKERQVANR